MLGIGKFLSSMILFGLALSIALLPQRASSGSSLMAMPQASADDSVPAYHPKPPQGELPATMNPELFTDPMVQNAYSVAAKIKKILYQQPCYCHCDRSQGHKSLLDCFASRHGSECGTCMYEDFFSYEQSRKGKTAAQIRAGIIRGEWKLIDAAKYQQPMAAN